ncbi:predicted protein [Naegleria gruberi]|uniref:Predicted protein n=1 Tax=Naegleria gruberi TaxID=5762 RepID=D2VYT9_NAEGR|nr:uncharacterized protein NAEGRDRAFT_59617 [Naegleria gruberi]EFC38016.1 predicted protein [Naegleria gruberi]|eukprot:XP_002670760.1 predicted protein [Naegleria gruberi strain NEG-M]
MESLNDEWIEIVSFLEPIDVLASLNGISRTVQELIDGFYISSQQLNNFNNHDDRNFKLENLKVYYYYDDGESDNNNNRISERVDTNSSCRCVNTHEGRIHIRRNRLTIIRYYLLGFSDKLEKKIVANELKLFNFYKNQLGSTKIEDEKNERKDKRYIKYAIIGNKKVGKSRFFRSFASGCYSPHLLPNIGADFIVRDCDFLNFKLKHQVWHGSILNYAKTTGIVARSFLHSASILVFSFSIDNRCSFTDISKYWIPLWKQFAPNTVAILLGFYPREEKFTRQVTQQEACELAINEFNSIYVEVNAAQMQNINLPSRFIHLECLFSNSWKILEERKESSPKSKPETDNSWCSLQ